MPDPMTGFDQQTLALLDAEHEIDIEAARADGRRLRVTIWVVVDGSDAFIRSWRGPTAQWYRAALAAPDGLVLHAGTRAIAVRAVPAAGAASIERCSRGLARKYGSNPSLPSMLRREVLDTTLRLEPRPVEEG